MKVIYFLFYFFKQDQYFRYKANIFKSEKLNNLLKSFTANRREPSQGRVISF